MTINKKNQVQRIFDSISTRYDFLNHFLSAGIDIYWRRKALRLTKIGSKSKLLDLACGTGDFALEAEKFGVKEIIGADLSFNMLKVFHEKSESSKGKIVQTIAEVLPFKSNSFTNITVAFGVRNFFDIQSAFIEFNRVLSNKGKATVLEFRLPEKGIVKSLYLFYFHKILPAIGRLISKDNEAYTYLPESVNDFDKNINLVELFKKAGFEKVEKHSLTFGICQVTIAYK
ncbi:MAG: bifunctional demethylmenaquinone methyltransferase/2-methoxy-6-polyprenyl-1,4-benzoquinol methylase UbiE [Melioribacteraceae bacterium]|nr:bifunctional demethylmenaquinone methyltransferase/2-methoxy-6-polyprenyl-1,4-benzoquinol methylase UbiE [Melioribacteraceae bacterium]